MSAQFTSNLDRVRDRHNRAVRAALMAAATVLHAGVVERKRRRPYGSGVGFLTGKFGKGRSRQAVAIGEVTVENGVQSVRVGTNYKLEVHWALGHFNIYRARRTGDTASAHASGWVRVDDWTPVLVEKAAAVRAKFAEVYNAMMAAAA